MLVKKASAWQFITSSSGGIGVEFVADEGGTIYLQDPAGKSVHFRYGAAGVGLSYGLKLPKIGKIQLKGRGVGASVAPASFPNTGKVYILDSFGGEELDRSDITGLCMFGEVGGGILGGVSGTAMVLGMDPKLAATVSLLPIPFNLYFESKLLMSATAVLVMAGLNIGIQAGGGGAVYFGGLI